jgi:hypothetical protein
LKGKAGYSEAREKKRKEKKKEKNKKMRWYMASLLFFSSQALLVVQAMETCVIPRSCLSVEHRASLINPDEAPHPMTEVGGVK